MKKLFLLLFLLPIFAEAQVYQAMPQAGYGPVKRMLFDSVLTLPLGITKLQNITGGRDIGQIRYNVTDSSLYSYTGYSWRKAGSNLDTTTIYTNLALKLNKSDTAAMLLPYTRVNRFLDSVAKLKTSIATKQNTLTLTTTGTSGAATLTGATLNIPQYAGASQDLQSVTNVGNTTTSAIEMNGGNLYMNGGNIKFDIAAPRGISWGDDVNTKLLLPPASLASITTNYLPDVDGVLTTTVNGIASDISGEITIPTASTSGVGLLSSTDWDLFNSKLNAADTNYLSESKLNISDTASMMAAAPRVQRFLDSVTNLKTSINLKLNKSDTTSMLTPYLRKVDTTGKFITSVFRKVASDSVFYVKGGANTFAFLDSIGTGGGGGSTNIYNTNGSLTSNRTLTLNSQPLTFLGTTRTRFHANGRMTIGDTTDAGFKLDVIGEDAKFYGVRVGRGVAGIASNTAVGNGVLGAITTGAGNTAIGNGAGAVITTGTNNTILGYLAGTALVDGSENILIGSGGKALTSGGNNVMVGFNAGLLNTTGTKNTYVGWTAGRSGSQNTAFGAQSLQSVTGTGNTALGQFAGQNNTSGAGNIYIGFNAGTYATTQSNLLVISSFDNSNYAGDQTKSIIYGQQSTTTANQILTVNGNLGINNITPAATAVVDITSITKGFLPPRMTTTQRTGIASPAEGLTVYDLTLHKLYVFDGTLWQATW